MPVCRSSVRAADTCRDEHFGGCDKFGQVCPASKSGKSTCCALGSCSLTSFKKLRHTGMSIITSHKYCEGSQSIYQSCQAHIFAAVCCTCALSAAALCPGGLPVHCFICLYPFPEYKDTFCSEHLPKVTANKRTFQKWSGGENNFIFFIGTFKSVLYLVGTKA